MGGEVILVALDASKENSNDYALEWTVQNVAKAGDFLILLVFLSSLGHPKPNLNQRLQSLACNFLSCGVKHSKGSPLEQVDHSKMDISRHVYNVYALKMQQLLLYNNSMQVHYKVKVILDMQPGSVAMEAKEQNPSWVILDRFLKKEGDHCTKQLNSNVVIFIDHAAPRMLKAVSPLAEENSSERDMFSANYSRELFHLNSENFSKDFNFKYLETFNPAFQRHDSACSPSSANRNSTVEESDITSESESVTSHDYESYLRGSLAKFILNFK